MNDPLENIVLMYGCPTTEFRPKPTVVLDNPVNVVDEPEDDLSSLEKLRTRILIKAITKVQTILKEYFPNNTSITIYKNGYKIDN